MNAKDILGLFQTNHWVIKQQMDGLTHEDSLLQLPFRGNCANWVLGHLVVSREGILQDHMGIAGEWTEDEIARYKYDSEPITSADDAGLLPLERIMADIDRTQKLLEDGLVEVSDAQLAVIVDEERQRTAGYSMLFTAWHEGYHVGQLEYLRQLAGKDDKII